MLLCSPSCLQGESKPKPCLNTLMQMNVLVRSFLSDVVANQVFPPGRGRISGRLNFFVALFSYRQRSRNPFIMSAVASKYITKAEIDLPMHRNRLRELQQRIDALGLEVKLN